MHEFYFRLKLWLVVLLLYSLIISHYSLDLLEFIIYHLSKNFKIQLILTQLEDLTLIVLDLINYSLLFYFIPFTLITLFLFFIPALYKKERIIFLKLIFLYFIGISLSFFVATFSFSIFYLAYSTQLFEFNSSNSTEVLVDLKKIIFFILIFFKFLLFFFLPFNLIFLCFFRLFTDYFNSKKYFRCFNFFIFFYLFFMGFFPVDNYSQLFIYYFSQNILLEMLLLLEFLVLQIELKKKFDF